jgi:hypothetical protein
MPLSANPDDTIPYVLETDRALPEAERPRFDLRFLTCRQRQTVAALVTQAQRETEDPEVAKLLDEAIGVGLARLTNVRHQGQPVAVGDDVPSGYLTPDELWELATAVLREPRLCEEKKRACSSQPTSGPAPSAASAATPAAA